MKQDLIAFWEYDIFPYILWGEVTKIVKNGRVEVWGSKGFYFKPLLLLPAYQGRELIKELEKIVSEKKSESDKIQKRYSEELKRLLSDYGK